MAETGEPKHWGPWEKADVVGKWLIPVAVTLATLFFNASLKQREARQNTFEAAIDVLRAPASAETQNLRTWALGVFREVTGIADAVVPDSAVNELRQGASLPSTMALSLPTAGPVRVAIIRLEGSSVDQSERIRSSLVEGGYTNVTLEERTPALFPNRAEVRFYHQADYQNARALSDYINTELGVPTQLNDRSPDPDAARRRVGELHVYVR